MQVGPPVKVLLLVVMSGYQDLGLNASKAAKILRSGKVLKTHEGIMAEKRIDVFKGILYVF